MKLFHFKHFVITILPTAVLLCATGFVLLGDHGLIAQKRLKTIFFEIEAKTAEVEQENFCLNNKVTRLKTQRKHVILNASDRLFSAPKKEPQSTVFDVSGTVVVMFILSSLMGASRRGRTDGVIICVSRWSI